MTYDDLVLNDRQLLEVFDVARREEALVMVHCEGYDAIRHLTNRLEQEGHIAPYYHGVSRPEVVEREATHRAISHAEIVGVPMMIVHVSGREAMEQMRWAQQRGLPVHAETCPQYITLTADDHEGPEHGYERARNMSARRRRATRRARRRSGRASRRACSRRSRPTIARSVTTIRKASSRPKARTSFRWVPNGIPGVETRLPILFSEGVSKGRISLAEIRRADIDQSRAIYGLYPRKGSIGSRFRCRYRAVGPEAEKGHSPGRSCITARTTRPGKVLKLRGGRS